MRNSYTTIYYKDRKISGIFAATLEKDFYEEPLLGAVTIHEDQIPQRDIPYFYGVSREPLEFEVTFAFEKPMDIYEIRKYVELFYGNRIYQPLAFEREDGYMTPTYYVLVVGEPEFHYNRTGVNKHVGWFKFNFRCNAPYGFYEEVYINKDKDGTLINDFTIDFTQGSLPTTNYVITITVGEGGELALKNQSIPDGTASNEFTFSGVEVGEVIVIDGRNKRITSTNQNSIYERWVNKEDDFFEIINNLNRIVVNLDSTVEIAVKMPRFV